MFNNAKPYDRIELIIKDKNSDPRIQSTRTLVYENISAQLSDGALLIITYTQEANLDDVEGRVKNVNTIKVFPLASITSFKTIC